MHNKADTINKKSLEIEALIRTYIKEEKYNKIELVGVFFHQLMIYATNYYIIKTANEAYEQDIEFPFLNSNYIVKTPHLYFKDKNYKKKKIYVIMEFIQKFMPIKKVIYISSSNSNDIKLFILKNLFKYKYKQINLNLYLSNWNDEVYILKNLLYKLCDLLDVKNRKDYFVDNFINYVNSFRMYEKRDFTNNSSLLIDSSLSILNRINSISFLQNKGNVISLGHGEHSMQIFDEPIVAYGELAYITDYITYGKNIIELKPSIGKEPNIYYRDSNKILNYFNEKDIKFKFLDKTIKILYVPTSFSGNKRYGPYVNIEDKDYEQWQYSLLNLGYNITYKRHLNANYKANFDIPNLEERELFNVMHDYDIYILDFISTATALLFATSKPIIFFDLGLRNLNKKVKKDFNNRVFSFRINLNKNFDKQIECGFKKYNTNKDNYVNTYTNKYSITKKNSNYMNIINEIINDKKIK